MRICVLVSAFDAALRFAIQGSGASCNPCLCAFHISFTFFFLTSLSLVYSVFFFFLILVRVHNCTIMIPSLFLFFSARSWSL